MVSVTELRQDFFGELKELAAKHEPCRIVRHGKPVAVLYEAPEAVSGKRKPIIDLNAIADFCRRHGVVQFALFGSILRNDFGAGSDVDVLVTRKTTARTLDEHDQMRSELESLFGRRVDLVYRDTLNFPRCNPFIRKSILSTAKALYDDAQ